MARTQGRCKAAGEDCSEADRERKLIGRVARDRYCDRVVGLQAMAGNGASGQRSTRPGADPRQSESDGIKQCGRRWLCPGRCLDRETWSAVGVA